MLHDILVNLLGRNISVGLDVLSRNTETAIEIDTVGLQGGKDQIGTNRAVLVGLKNGEDDGQNILNEVVQQNLITFLKLNSKLL